MGQRESGEPKARGPVDATDGLHENNEESSAVQRRKEALRCMDDLRKVVNRSEVQMRDRFGAREDTYDRRRTSVIESR